MNSALLLIDFQNDYFPNGRMPLDRSIEASQKAQELLQAFRSTQKPIVHIQHISTHPNATYLLPCTKGIEFHANLQPSKKEMVIKKHYPNSFKDTGLLNFLTKNKVHRLVICGLLTHLCIDATVRAGYDLGFSCTVVHDACATKSLEFSNISIPSQTVQHSFLAALQLVYANIVNTRELLQTVGVSNNNTLISA